MDFGALINDFDFKKAGKVVLHLNIVSLTTVSCCSSLVRE